MATDLREVQDGVRQQLIALLLEKVENDRFPSGSMMDLVEELVGPDEIPLYTEILMRKIQDDEFPSLDLIGRIKRFSGL
jgi:hypothetical protein